MRDDDLRAFALHGAPPLPVPVRQGHVVREGARIWYATFGSGPTVVLLHGGLGHAGNWGNQVPTLIKSGYHTIVIDSRGHGRSTRDDRPYTYEEMSSDAIAVLDELGVDKARFVGWSDGACVALITARIQPARVAGVFFFACNMNASGTKKFDGSNPLIRRVFARHKADYERLSSTPERFGDFVNAVTAMQQTQPNYSTRDLVAIHTSTTVAQSADDEFITLAHAKYLARTIPGAKFVELRGVTHFAPLQRPDVFNDAVLGFLRLGPDPASDRSSQPDSTER